MIKGKKSELIKGIGIDLGISLYLVSCFAYLLYYFAEKSFSTINILVISVGLAFLFLLIPSSPGKQLFKKEDKNALKLFSKFHHYVYALVIVLTFVVGWFVVEIEPIEFFTGISGARNIVRGLFSPDGEIFYPMLGELVKTIYLALMATIFAVPLAFVLSFFAASNLMNRSFLGRAIYVIIRTFSTVVRSIESMVWAIIFSVWVGIGPFAGMMALMIHSIAALVKLYSEQIEDIDHGPIEAIASTGASTLQIWIYAVIPQIINPFLAFTIYRWDINVRMATIVGFVGGGGIGLFLSQKQQMCDWNGVGVIVWLIALAVWIMDMVSGQIRKRLLEN